MDYGFTFGRLGYEALLKKPKDSRSCVAEGSQYKQYGFTSGRLGSAALRLFQPLHICIIEGVIHYKFRLLQLENRIDLFGNAVGCGNRISGIAYGSSDNHIVGSLGHGHGRCHHPFLIVFAVI